MDIKDKIYVIIQAVEIRRLKPRQAVEEIYSLLELDKTDNVEKLEKLTKIT